MKYTIRRTALTSAIAASFLLGMANGQSSNADSPAANPSGYSHCDHTNAPELCAPTPKPTAPAYTHMLPQSMRHACPSDDEGVNCFVDETASHGHSYIVREFPGKAHMICVMYLSKADAAKWDYCSGDLVKGMNTSK